MKFYNAVAEVSSTEPPFFAAAFERKPIHPKASSIGQALDYSKISKHVRGVISAHGVKDRIEVAWDAYLDSVGAAGAASAGSTVIRLSPALYTQLDPKYVAKVYAGIGLHEVSHVYESDASHCRVASRSARRSMYFNLIEDERIEAICRQQSPNFAYYLWVVKEQLLKKSLVGFNAKIDDPETTLETLLDAYVFSYVRGPHWQTDEERKWEPIPGVCMHSELNDILDEDPQNLSSTAVLRMSVEVEKLVLRILDHAKSASACTDDTDDEESSESSEVDEDETSDASPEASDSGSEQGEPDDGQTAEGGPTTGGGSSSSGGEGSASDGNSTDTGSGEGNEADESESTSESGDADINEESRPISNTHGDSVAHTMRGVTRHEKERKSDLSEGKMVSRANNSWDSSPKGSAEQESFEQAVRNAVRNGELPIPVLKKLAELTTCDVTEPPRVMKATVAEHLVSIEKTDMEMCEVEDRGAGNTILDRREIITRIPILHPHHVNEYKRIKRQQSGTIRSMVQAFNIRQANRDEVQTEQISGRLSRRRIAMGATTSRVFERRNSYQTQGLDIALLIDESGSMAGRKIIVAREVAIVLTEALQRVEAAHLNVYGHSTSGFLGDAADRACVINRYSDSGKVDNKLLGAIEDQYCNFDGWAIQHVGNELLHNGIPAQKWLIVVSDGMPSGTDYYGEEATAHSRKQVVALEKKGVRVLGVDIQGIDCDQIFTHYVKFTDHRTLVSDMRKLVTKALLRSRELEVGE